ncbi:hypothetical protein Q0M94_25185 (plasmid) [Deinococcus radiomollis]|uniref:hypothetical protein n=1 Tax=Deinococcus radiomollis TaxID=468916 RepID=UPI003891A8EA
MTEPHSPGPHAEQEQELRERIRARWGQNIIVRGFTRKADGTLLFVQLQDPHVPRDDSTQAKSVSWDPRTDLLLGDEKSVDLFKWFEQQALNLGG